MQRGFPQRQTSPPRIPTGPCGAALAFSVPAAPESESQPSAKCRVLSCQAPGYVTFFLFVRLLQPLPNQPPRMGAELRGASRSLGGGSSWLLHSDFRLWLPSSPARRGVAREKMGSCHLPKRESWVGRAWSLSVTTRPRMGRLTEEVTLLPPRILAVVGFAQW